MNPYLREDLDIPGFRFELLYGSHERECMLYQLARQTERQTHIEQAAKGKYINGSVVPYRMIVQGVMPAAQITTLPR
jgi:hypothetical protein